MRIQAHLESSTDGGNTWGRIATTTGLRVRGLLPEAYDGQLVDFTIPISETVMAEPNTTYDFRVVLRFVTDDNTFFATTPTTIGYTGFVWNLLFIEEIAPAYTDTGYTVDALLGVNRFTVAGPNDIAMGDRLANNAQGNNSVTISAVETTNNITTVTHGIRGTTSPFTAGDSIFRQ